MRRDLAWVTVFNVQIAHTAAMTVGPFHVALASNKLRRCQINPAELNRHIPHRLHFPSRPCPSPSDCNNNKYAQRQQTLPGQHTRRTHSTTLQWPHTISVRDVVLASCLHALLKILIKLQLATLKGGLATCCSNTLRWQHARDSFCVI